MSMRQWYGTSGIVLLALFTMPSVVQGETSATRELNKLLAEYSLPGLQRSAIGVTRAGTPIPCFVDPAEVDPHLNKFRILLIGGPDKVSVERVLAAQQWFQQKERPERERFVVSCVPFPNPDAWAAGKSVSSVFPPTGSSYNNLQQSEAQYLWRWIGMHAPDLVVDVRKGTTFNWQTAERPLGIVAEMKRRFTINMRPGKPVTEASDLIVALSASEPSETGTVPAIRLTARDDHFLQGLLNLLKATKKRPPSAARLELQRRVGRSPRTVARELAGHYGHDLRQVVYIPALALIGRTRLGMLDKDDSHLRDVERIVAPYVRGEKASLGKRVSGSALSGHLIFTHLARQTKKPRYLELARQVADLGFKDGKPLPSMPAHSEMSDSVFMGCAILAETGRLTGEPKYFEMCLRHLKFMQKLCLRADGLYRHSPLDEAAWGRGNGFPALGLALCASALPKDAAQRDPVLKSLRSHLRALAKHQDYTGAWHQVIDRPESYRELTSTCMITFAIVRGMREGWLSKQEFEPVVKRSWRAILTRIGKEGRLVDVCTGTGKQKNLRAYYDRTAILGRDARGGAMALLVATEIAMWKQGL